MAAKSHSQRTVDAIAIVVNELHDYIKASPAASHPFMRRLVDQSSADELAARFSGGMPGLVKVALGREEGIDLDELAQLAGHPSCVPDNMSVGCYFIFGRPYAKDSQASSTGQSSSATCDSLSRPLPSPVASPGYVGESANSLHSMRGRCDQHLSTEYRRGEPTKPLYKLLDNERAPQKPYALAICKITTLDKPFCKFAEMVTRLVFGLHVDNATNAGFKYFASNKLLEFTTPVIPTNATNTLTEGSYGFVPPNAVDYAIRHGERKRLVAEYDAERKAAKRTRYNCNRCGGGDSWCWSVDPEQQGEHICDACRYWYNKYDSWPTLQDLEDRHARNADLASRPDAPGYCENELCQSTTTTHHWNWNKILEIYLCTACQTHAHYYNNESRVPPANAAEMTERRLERRQRPLPDCCENDLCAAPEPGGDKTHWNWHAELKIWLCMSCSQYSRFHNGELRVPPVHDPLKDEHPAPGHCENEKCGVTTTPTNYWSWNTTHKLWLCGACHHWVKNHDGEMRPGADCRRQKPEVEQCGNPHCLAPESGGKWRLLKDLGTYFCGACYQYARAHDMEMRVPKTVGRAKRGTAKGKSKK